MLEGRSLKLTERRSGQRIRSPRTDSVVVHPCVLRTITDKPVKVSTVHPTQNAEKRYSELRVVSLNLEDQPAIEIKRSPLRMPSYCLQLKRSQNHYNRSHERNHDDEFMVRGFEVGSASANSPESPFEEIDTVPPANEEDFEEFQDLNNGIHIQLTDCCQCACDLFNSSHLEDTQDHEMNFNTEICRSSRTQKAKSDVCAQASGVLDPNILKVIRVTMNSKN